MNDSVRDITEDSTVDFDETFLSSKCFHAFFFYSGAFVIDLHWGLFWRFIPAYLEGEQYFSSVSSMWLLLFVLLCCVFFSLLLGALTSIQQSSNSRQSTAILLMVFGIGLTVSSLGLSIIPIFFQTSENNDRACRLIIICFFLIALTISGYTTSFFSLSIYFSDQIISAWALPFWAAMGQLASMGIVYVSSGLSNSPFQLLTIFAIYTFLILIFMVLFWVFIRKTLPSSERSKESITFYSLLRSRFGPEFRKDFKNYFCEGPLLNILVLGIFLNGFMFYVELQIDDWSEFFKSVTKDIYYLYEDDSLDLIIQIGFYQQIMQLASSILFFTVAFFCVKYFMTQLPPSAKLKTYDTTTTASSEEFKFHVDRRMYKFYSTQWVMSAAAFIGLLLPCFYLTVIGLMYKISLTVMFTLSGLGRILIYSGRESQRSSMRIVRFEKGYTPSEDSVKQYDFFDRFLQTGFYGAFLALGQILAILAMHLLPHLSSLWVFLGGPILAIVLRLSFGLCHTSQSDKNSENDSNNLAQGRESEIVRAKILEFRPSVVLRTSKKHLY